MQNTTNRALLQRLTLCRNLCKVSDNPVTGGEEPGAGPGIEQPSTASTQESHSISNGSSAKPETVAAGADMERLAGLPTGPLTPAPVPDKIMEIADVDPALAAAILKGLDAAPQQYAQLCRFLPRILELELAFRSVNGDWLRLEDLKRAENSGLFRFTQGEVVLINSAIALLAEMARALAPAVLLDTAVGMVPGLVADVNAAADRIAALAKGGGVTPVPVHQPLSEEANKMLAEKADAIRNASGQQRSKAPATPVRRPHGRG